MLGAASQRQPPILFRILAAASEAQPVSSQPGKHRVISPFPHARTHARGAGSGVDSLACMMSCFGHFSYHESRSYGCCSPVWRLCQLPLDRVGRPHLGPRISQGSLSVFAPCAFVRSAVPGLGARGVRLQRVSPRARSGGLKWVRVAAARLRLG